jgi:hypothetical protein
MNASRVPLSAGPAPLRLPELAVKGAPPVRSTANVFLRSKGPSFRRAQHVSLFFARRFRTLKRLAAQMVSPDVLINLTIRSFIFACGCSSILAAERDSDRIAIYVDRGRPNAGRAEPFYSKIKELAGLLTPNGMQVVVYQGKRVTVVLPDKDVDLGVIEDGDLIITRPISTSIGVQYEALKR